MPDFLVFVAHQLGDSRHQFAQAGILNRCNILVTIGEYIRVIHLLLFVESDVDSESDGQLVTHVDNELERLDVAFNPLVKQVLSANVASTGVMLVRGLPPANSTKPTMSLTDASPGSDSGEVMAISAARAR